MSKKRKRAGSSGGAAGSATAAPPPASSRRRAGAIIGAVAAMATAAVLYYVLSGVVPRPGPVVSSGAAPPAFVGARACAACHAKEYEAWRGSQHDLAMQHVSGSAVLGNFENAKFSYGGITSTFFRRDGKFFVNTDGPDGKLADFEIKYTFGVAPLQQYLVEFPDGRIQALSLAWDSRPKDKGGQRWFHLYPGQNIKAGDRLHWTGIDQNWNFQCAECHSTNLRKNFDAQTNRFDTKWSELNVACEACHGPASNHVAWAKKEGNWQRMGADKGLAVALDERRGATWTIDGKSGNAKRSAARPGQREIETCALCHARRGQFTDDHVFGRPLVDTHRVSLLEQGLYYPDGQQRDEVYTYASFLQSKMFAEGVTCSDCHDPHTLKLRAAGNGVCAQCHSEAKYDGTPHHGHAPGSKGAECAACHMPTTTYMVVDPRHDHSFRIPRPDRTVSMGVPNACNQCHRDRKPQWAAEQIRKWAPQPAPGHQKFAEALAAGQAQTAGARGALIGVVADRAQPAVARASAAAQLAAYPGPVTVDVLKDALNDASPLVRAAAVEAIGGMDAATRAQWLPRLLEDPVRSVRMAAARALAPLPPDRLRPESRAAFDKALQEFIAAQQFNADRPEAHSNLGALYAERGDTAAAEAEMKKALAIDPGFVPAAANLADLYRSRGAEKDAEAILRATLKRDPRSAPLHYSLALSLVRQKRMPEAMGELKEAMRLAPENPRFAYTYAIALNGTGKAAEAIALLEAAHRRFTGNPEILQTLATMERDRGARVAAVGYARKLAELTPDDPQARQLLQSLEK